MATHHERVIRVFVSSTFRDMHEEREELVKRVFPRLRKLCEQRGVTWGEVDLRWGITDEAKAEGRVLPLCLAEIHRCRPYFIGLLGERYGWVPQSKEIPPELLTLEPWLKEHQHKSVTELEILHGVLNNPAMAELAFFYFRDPAYLKTLPSKQQTEYREGPTPEDLARLGPKKVARWAEERRHQLAALKERIRESFQSGTLKNPVRENYPNPQTLGDLVYQDLKGVIDRLFPEEEVPDALARERLEHEAFARSRTVIEVRPGVFQGVYLGHPKYFQILDRHAQGDGPPLVVLGESGVGKSALLANWAFHFRKKFRQAPPAKASWWQRLTTRKRPDPSRSAEESPLLFMHFIGASVASTDWHAMLRRIMGELKERFLIPEEIPNKPEELRLAFSDWLSLAGARGRVLLILDALNQLEDKDGAPDLVWLPSVVPANARLILSTLPGRPLEELKRRGWQENHLTVQHLTPEERRDFIPPYLKQYGKELSPQLAARVASARQCRNPLYLRTLLEELRVFGSYQTLEERLRHYLEAPSVDRLYEKVLERWEKDYERDRPLLVRDALTLIWAARRGLSEAEILELLGKDGQPLPHAHWSPFFLAAEASLVNRGGLLGFFHTYLRQAVENRYLSDPKRQPNIKAQQRAHLRLSDFFMKQNSILRKGDEAHKEKSAKDPKAELIEKGIRALNEILNPHPRWIDELPWQLSQARAWDQLYHLLSNLSFFNALWRANEFEVKQYWAQIEDNSPFRLMEAYRPILSDPNRFSGYADNLFRLLKDTGHPREAHNLSNVALESSRRVTDKGQSIKALAAQAVILKDLGRLQEAMNLHKEEERLCRELKDRSKLAYSFGNQAVILIKWGKLQEAMKLLKETENIFRALEDGKGLSTCLGNQVAILHAWGKLEEALKLLQEEQRICLSRSDRGGLSASLGNQAVILKDLGKLQEAMVCHKEEERLCRELGDRAGISRTLGNQALILNRWGKLKEAMANMKEQERLCRELEDEAGLQACLGNQAMILVGWKKLQEAMTLLKEMERLNRKLQNINGLAISLANQATLLINLGRAPEALPMARESYRLATGHGLTALAGQIKPILDLFEGQ